jgi:uncharacterized protein YecT (DUF1311 family)
MRHRFLLGHFATALGILLAWVGSAGARNLIAEPMTRAEEYEAVMALKQCKLSESNACEKLLLKHYCKHSGSSFYASRCAASQRQEVDARLQQTYQKLVVQLTGSAEKSEASTNAARLLSASQAKWKAYRDAQCEMVSESFAGGTLQPVITETCMKEEALHRIESLKRVAREFGVEL